MNNIGYNKANIAKVEAEIECIKQLIESQTDLPKNKARLQKMLDVNYPNLLACYRKKLEKDEAKLTALLIKREKGRNRRTIGVCVFAILISLFIFWMIYC